MPRTTHTSVVAGRQRVVSVCAYLYIRMLYVFVFMTISIVHVSSSVPTAVIPIEFAGSCRFMANPRDTSGLLGGVYAPIQTSHILLESMGAVSTLGV